MLLEFKSLNPSSSIILIQNFKIVTSRKYKIFLSFFNKLLSQIY